MKTVNNVEVKCQNCGSTEGLMDELEEGWGTEEREGGDYFATFECHNCYTKNLVTFECYPVKVVIQE